MIPVKTVNAPFSDGCSFEDLVSQGPNSTFGNPLEYVVQWHFHGFIIYREIHYVQWKQNSISDISKSEP